MSHEIVRKIRIEDRKVFITCTSNNVYPKYYKEHLAEDFTEILQKEGSLKLDLHILKLYEQYIFQAGVKNKYTKALEILRDMPDYAKIDWRKSDYKDNCPIQLARQSELYSELLLRALNSQKTPKKQIVLSIGQDHQTFYFRKIVNNRSSSSIKWTGYKHEAKVYSSEYRAKEMFDNLSYIKGIQMIDLCKSNNPLSLF